jgi:hypothetical protein
MKELLLIGGSHLASVVSYLKDINGFKKPLKNDYIVKAVGCDDLDLVNYLKADGNANLNLSLHEPLKQSCIKEYGNSIISFDHERIICLISGSWHRAVYDTIWKTYYPAEIEPELNQVTPISTFEVINRIYMNIFTRLNLIISLLLTNKLNFFVVLQPPMPLIFEGGLCGIPIKTGKYIYFMCYNMYINALYALNIKYVDLTNEAIDNDGFLKFDYNLKFADWHANNKYGACLWKKIINLLDENNWNPLSFRVESNNFLEFIK